MHIMYLDINIKYVHVDFHIFCFSSLRLIVLLCGQNRNRFVQMDTELGTGYPFLLRKVAK